MLAALRAAAPTLGGIVVGVLIPNSTADDDEISVFNEKPKDSAVPPAQALNVDVASAGAAGDPNGGDEDEKFNIPSEDDVINSAMRPSRPGSTSTRGFQALQKKIDNPAKSANFGGLKLSQGTVNSLIREALGSPNPIIRTGRFRSGQEVIDIINPSTGRGVRLLRGSGEFDTFVNL